MNSRIKTVAKFGLLALLGFALGDVAVSLYDGKLRVFHSLRTQASNAQDISWCPAQEKEIFFVSCSGFF